MIKEVNLIIIAMDEEFEALLNNIKDYQVEDFLIIKYIHLNLIKNILLL